MANRPQHRSHHDFDNEPAKPIGPTILGIVILIAIGIVTVRSMVPDNTTADGSQSAQAEIKAPHPNDGSHTNPSVAASDANIPEHIDDAGEGIDEDADQ